MDNKLLRDFGDVRLALDLIDLGARIQVLESETDLSRGRLIGLYKEVHGKSPAKGLLPFSTDWFMTWLPNIHSSLFYAIYLRLSAQSPEMDKIERMTKAFRLYRDQVTQDGEETVLDITRAWTMLRFFDNNMLETIECMQCTGHFISHAHTPKDNYLCGICAPPSRAGKTKKAAG